MASSNVNIRLHGRWVEQFASQGFRLCTAFGIESGGKTHFDVVAAAYGIGENIDVSWEERYAIAASNDSFMRGIRFNVRNDYTPINYGQKYVLRKNWSGGDVQNDSDAPSNGFIFEHNDKASVVLAKRLGGREMAIYFDNWGPTPPGTTQLVPKPFIRLWFGRDQEGTLISNIRGSYIDVDMSAKNSANVVYNESGNWSQV